MVKLITIEEKYDGVLLKKYLSEVLNYSRRQITRLYTSRSIYINDDNKNLTYILKTGDNLKIELAGKDLGKDILNSGEIEILYKDEYFVIINKPAGLCAHPTNEHKKDNMETILSSYLNKKVYPCGRLDKNVSGVMIYAIDSLSASKLNKLREENKLNKYYECVVKGTFKEKEGRLIYSLIKDEKSHKYIFDESGRKCITDYWTIKEGKDTSLLRIHILTGRSHQIRAGLSSFSHPIIGDNLYGEKDSRINRVALHAYSIEFIHPFLNENIKVEVELPRDIERLIK